MNIGGGFPASYRQDIASIDDYGEAIRASIVKHFGNRQPRIIAEPGHCIDEVMIDGLSVGRKQTIFFDMWASKAL